MLIMSKGVFDKRFATHIPNNSAYNTLLCTNELGYVEADVSYKIIGIPQESILFGYTTAGQGMLEYKGTKYQLKKDSLFCVNCRHPHNYQTSKDIWKFYWFHAVGTIAHSLIKNFDADVFVRNDVQHFVGCWENMYNLAEKNSLYVDMKIAPIINNIFNMIFDDSSHDARMQKAEEFIHLNYNKKITIDDMAKNACMSKYHFSRLFKESTGESPYKYLCMYRIEKAKELLISTPLSVNETAVQVGFDDVASFIYLFKKHTFVSPLQFRKHYNNLF